MVGGRNAFRACLSCLFWDAFDGKDSGSGRCRVAPPRIVPGGDADHELFGHWPATLRNDWCGAYVLKVSA